VRSSYHTWEERVINHESLVSISEASRILGVSEAALRQWTDEGKVKAFITPGGHRRYSRSELKRFLRSHSKTLGTKDLVLELTQTASLHREIARTHPDTPLHYDKLSPDTRERLATLGRNLLELIIRYITVPSKRADIVEQARAVGRSHGEMLVGLGFPLTDAVEAFISHRGPFVDATTHLMRKREAVTGRVVDAIPMISYIMDEALVSLVAAYQQNRNAASTDSGEGQGPY